MLGTDVKIIQLLVSAAIILLPHFSVAYLVSTSKTLVSESWWYDPFEVGQMLLLTLTGLDWCFSAYGLQLKFGSRIYSEWIVKQFHELLITDQWHTKRGDLGCSNPPRNSEGTPESCQIHPDCENC